MARETQDIGSSIIAEEARGGLLLIAAAALALVLANSPLAPAYAAILHHGLGPLSVELWINDALMALFFLGVGLEVKREFVVGALSHKGSRALPIVAAAAGMIAPALLYLAVAGGDPALTRGWAIPAATDIAFALALLALAGRGLPPSLGVLLTTIAIVDDIGAILIIALFYTAAIDAPMLALAALLAAGLWLLNRRGILRLTPYLLLGALLWIAVFRSGVHATIAGVVTGLAIPLGQGESSPLCRLEKALHPWTAYAIIPLFGLANAGLALRGGAHLGAPVTLAVLFGLFVGKQLGIGFGLWAAIRSGLAKMPSGATTGQLYGVALLAGIGFTMSLFIGGLAFADPARFAEVKLGVLTGSLLSAAAGFAVLRRARRGQTPLSSAPEGA